MPARKKVIIYLYNRLADPLIQSNIYLYLMDMARAKYNNYEYTLVTYEDPEKMMPEAERAALRAELEALDIHWKYVTWHKGTGILLKLLDVLNAFWLMLKLRLQGYRYIVTLASIAGNFAYLYSLVCRFRLYLYQYEPHSEYGLDSGAWSADSKQFRLQQLLEKRSAKYARVISSGTRHMEQRLQRWGVKAKFYRIQSVVDDARFVFDAAGRERIRRQLGIRPEEKVLIYPGKFGFTYYIDEAFVLFNEYLAMHPDYRVLLITSNPMAEVEELMRKHAVPEARVLLLAAVPYAEMPAYLSAADLALINVRPGPSQKFVSNIKVGEYLCTGLPYIIIRGISEDDLFAEEHRTGVVLDHFAPAEIRAAAPRIAALFAEDTASLKHRCRTAGIEYRGFSRLHLLFRQAMQSLTEEN
jgi:glycosyltransferase involved in cell wall biosynthesis